MPTLLKVTDADDKLVGKCDQLCYDATATRCRCICGGRNHGIGLQAAARNLLDAGGLFADVLLMHAALPGHDVHRSLRCSYYAHPRLFPTEPDQCPATSPDEPPKPSPPTSTSGPGSSQSSATP